MKTIFTLFIVLISGVALGQTKISGSVTDQKGESVPGANVFLLDTYDGTTSGVDGSFEFSSDEKGTQVIVVKFIGFKEFRQSVELKGGKLEVQVLLKEEVSQLQAVTITAGSFAASDESRKTIFKPIDIVTTAGATADIAGALNTLPGTQKVGESGRLFVRGGDGNETRTFIDGMLVMEAYGVAAPNTPSRGRFLPFMFKGTSFSTGGYSAEYGQALSSALVLDSKDEEQSSRTDIGILSVGGDVAHTQAWDRGSFAGKVQYTNIRPYFGLINQEIDWNVAPASLEGSAAFRNKIGKQGIVKVFGNFNQSDYSLYNHDIDDPSKKTLMDLTNKYRYLNGFLKTSLNEKWGVRGGLSYTYTNNDITLGGVGLHETDEGLHGKVTFTGSLSDQFELKTGVEIIHHDYVAAVDTSSYALEFDEIITAAFAETDIYASNKFVTRLGGRLEYNSLLKATSVDPRVSFAYKVGKLGQLSFAYGKFRQSPRNDLLRADNELQAEKADHYILNYQFITENNRTFRIETYYKTYKDLVKYENGNPFTLNNDGFGYAKGLEVFWRDNRTIRNVDYWISYSYLDTKRNSLGAPYSVMPSFASAHNFSAVYKHFITDLKTQLSLTYSYTSGRPYNDPNEEKFNSSRTKSYQDLSASLSYLPKPYLIVHLSCTNLLGRDNIFGYQFSNTPTTDGIYNSRAIRQAAPRFLFLGIFITISKNKSINQLPSL